MRDGPKLREAETSCVGIDDRHKVGEAER